MEKTPLIVEIYPGEQRDILPLRLGESLCNVLLGTVVKQRDGVITDRLR